MLHATNIEQSAWDVIVIGTGMGGATLGFKLAEAGQRVLFLEKGQSFLPDHSALSGQYAELFFPEIERPESRHADILRRAGRWLEPVVDMSGSQPQSQIPFIGSGTGGSSALYGMAMERFLPDDFEPRRFFRNQDAGTLPERWPIAYSELKPYYEAAETLYRVKGTVDALRHERINTYAPPPALAPSNAELSAFLSSRGFHPYRLPLACDFVADCQNCQGFLCSHQCRNDSGKICLRPAIERHGASLMDLCDVVRLDAEDGVIRGVECRWEGRPITLRSARVVLAAGALHTPAILLRSASSRYPSGLANSSDQVGRNLMRHYLDMYAIAVRQKPQPGDNLKQLAFNDLRHDGGERFGTIQSFGRLPPPSIQAATIQRTLRNGRLAMLAGLFGLARPMVEVMLSQVFSRRVALTSIMEDVPYRENRVALSSAGELTMHYRIHPDERRRITRFRARVKQALRPYSSILIKQAESNARLAHVCGTCRFGHDPKESVLNAKNQAHDLPNLFVVDSSFFPSSAGTNPALTIAANALRVADFMIQSR